MAWRAIGPESPEKVRRFVQVSYDRYMSGDQMRVGMHIVGVQPAIEAKTAPEREEAYEALAAKWPNKSRRLMRNVAKEIVFDQLCLEHHRTSVSGLFDHIEGLGDRVRQDVPLVYASGLGRNACLSTVQLEGHRTEIICGLDHGFFAVMGLLAEKFGEPQLLIDPDLALGRITGPTPEIFDPSAGNEHLAQCGMEYFADTLNRLSA